MATYEIFVGGPGRGDTSRSQYPAKAFLYTSALFAKLRAAAHKGPSEYALTRTLDFKNDYALAEFVRNQLAAGAPLAQGDVLGSVIIPANYLLKGVFVRVETPVVGLTLTLNTRATSVAAVAFGTVNCAVAGSSYRSPGEAAGGITEGAVTGGQSFANVPRILDVTLTAVGAAGLGALRIHISPLLSQLEEGQF